MPHIHDKIDFTVEVLIVQGDKVLLRKHDKYKKWYSIGGHIELDEDPAQAAVREVREEVGLDIKLFGEKLKVGEEGKGYFELIPPRFLNRHHVSDTHQHVTLVYFATIEGGRLTNTAGREQSEEIRWFTREELADPHFGISDSFQQYARAALDAVT